MTAMFYICCYKIVKIMDKKKEVKYFISEFDRINEGLQNRNLDADAVINILQLPLGDTGQKGTCLVYYRE
jgi:hypothetical protein